VDEGHGGEELEIEDLRFRNWAYPDGCIMPHIVDCMRKMEEIKRTQVNTDVKNDEKTSLMDNQAG